MAPEQAEGRRESVTTAADVHALGAILFELLTGSPPFRAETMLETLRLVREQEAEHPCAINPGIDRDLATIVLKCLEKHPVARYHSAAALAEDLDRWLADLPILARPATLSHRVVKWVRRRPAAAAFIITAMVATLATTLAVRGYISAARLRGTVASTGLALKAERESHRLSEEELIEAQKRKLRQEEEQYGQQIMAVEQLLANVDAARDDPARIEALLLECPPRLRGWEWGYLKKRLHAEILTISGHSGFLCGIDFRPGANEAYCRTELPKDSIWDPGAGSGVRRMHGPDGGAYGAAIDRTGTRLATAGSDGQVKVWNVVEGRLDHVFQAHQGWVSDVAFSPGGDQLASAGKDGMVRIWSVERSQVAPPETRVPSLVIAGECGWVLGIAWSADGKRLAAAGKNGTVRVWDLSQTPPGRPVIFRGHENEVCCVAFHPRGTTIASGGADRFVRIWDAATGVERLHFPAAGSRLNAISYSPDGTKLATGSLDGPVGLWDATTGMPVGILRGHVEPVFEVAFNS